MHGAHSPSWQQSPAPQSSSAQHCEVEMHAPAQHCCPSPHWAPFVHSQGPQLRVMGSQHSLAKQSAAVVQHSSHEPPTQHSPTAQSASAQHSASRHVPLQHLLDSAHCESARPRIRRELAATVDRPEMMPPIFLSRSTVARKPSRAFSP